MAQEAHDEFGCDAQLFLAALQRRDYTISDSSKRHAALCMRLRIEEHLDMDDIVFLGALQIRESHVMEVLLGAQHIHALIIKVQEFLKIVEIIGRLGLFQRLERNLDLIALGQRHHHLRFETAFDVQVQLSLGQARDEIFVGGHGSLLSGQSHRTGSDAKGNRSNAANVRRDRSSCAGWPPWGRAGTSPARG